MPRQTKTPPVESAKDNHEPDDDPQNWFPQSLNGLGKLSKAVGSIRSSGGILSAVGVLCMAGAVYGGQFVLRNPSYLPWPHHLASEAATKTPDRFPQTQTLYIVYHNPDGTLDGPPQKWILHIQGIDTLTGRIELPEQHKTGILTGFVRDNVAVITYASEAPSGHGFGTFFLAPRRPADASKGDVWAGVAAFHDCTTQAKTVCTTFRLGAAAAMMSDQVENVDKSDNDYYRTFRDAILTQHLGWTSAEMKQEVQAE